MSEGKELEIYIHIPFCVKKCNYCDFVSSPQSEETIQSYVDALCSEIKMMSGGKSRALRFFEKEYTQYKVRSVYIGGGTPSILTVEKLKKITDCLKEVFDLKLSDKKIPALDLKSLTGLFVKKQETRKRAFGTEFTIECNPGTVDKEKLRAYRKMGINRISFGLQSADDNELKMLGRIHSFDDFLDSFKAAREAGFDNINIDLMQAIPGQNLSSWKKTLAVVSSLGPEHISAYSLIIEDGTPFSKWHYKDSECSKDTGCMESDYICFPDGRKGFLPSEDEERDIYYYTKEFLEKSGYKRYEISNFSKEGFECIHNLGYWRRTNYIGFGLNSSSLVDNTRWKNTEILNDYIKCFTKDFGTAECFKEVEKLTCKAQMEEFMFLGLRITKGISKKEFFDTFGRDIYITYGEQLASLKADGLISEDEEYISLTNKGIDVSNVVLAEFLLD